MQITGVQQTTLLDYPGKVATVVFTPGCNFRCRFCHNPDMVLPERIKDAERIPEDVFFSFLDKRHRVLDGVVICGGEPTLQPDLRAFCQKVKEYGLLVKLDSNGRAPDILQTLINEKLIDYVAMDIKIDASQRTYLIQNTETQENYKKSIAILIQGNIDYEFRTTMVLPYHSIDAFKKMVETIRGAKKYYLQYYRSGVTLDPHFDGRAFSPDEMEIYKNIAQEYVQSCEIRA